LQLCQLMADPHAEQILAKWKTEVRSLALTYDLCAAGGSAESPRSQRIWVPDLNFLPVGRQCAN